MLNNALIYIRDKGGQEPFLKPFLGVVLMGFATHRLRFLRWRDRLQQLAGFMRARRGMASSLIDFLADATWAASVDSSTKDACGTWGTKVGFQTIF